MPNGFFGFRPFHKNGTSENDGQDDASHAIEVFASEEAFSNVSKNPLRRYPSPDKDGERLYPLVSPSVAPSFSIEKGDTVYAIGSGFARNLEGALQKSGMEVLSRQISLGKIGESVGAETNFLNKYTAASILNDLTWALERDTFPGEDIAYPISDDVYCDLQLGLVRLPYPLSEIMDMRTRFLDNMVQVAEANVVIITLGYVEAWYDTELDLYLNIAPPQRLCRRFPGRFEMRVLGFEDILGALEGIYALLKKHQKQPQKYLVTVSPVPLLSTFRKIDVLVANSYSKSVQRAAVETFVADKADVNYFPSYESVTLSNPNICWARGDYRHVSPDVVARIMSNVLVSYMDDSDTPGNYLGSQMTREATYATARLLIKLQEATQLAELHGQNRALFRKNEKLLGQITDTLQKHGHRKAAILALEDLAELAPERPLTTQRLITLLSREPDQDTRTLELLKVHEERFPTRSKFRRQISADLEARRK